MKILITGASGFVGQALIRAWKDEHILDVVSRQQSRLFNACRKVYTWDNIGESDEQYDAVIHLAGLAHDTSNVADEEQYFAVNLGLTEAVVNWMNRSQSSPTQLIYLSSIKTYSDEPLLTENTVQTPESIYGKSKLAAEQLIKSKLDARLSFTILQPVMIYGAGNKGNLVRLNHMFGKVPYPFKNWKNNRSILSINNLIAVLQGLLMRDELVSNTYIVSDDACVSTFNMISALQANTYKPPHFSLPHIIPKVLLKTKIGLFEKVLGDLVVSNNKIKAALDWQKMPYETLSELEELSL